MIVILVAVASNTSRAAQALGVALVLILLLGPVRAWLLHRWRAGSHTVGGWGGIVAGAVLIGAVLFAVGQASELGRPLARWQGLSESWEHDARWPAALAGLGGVRDAGWCGLGPGTFPVVFPYLTGPFGSDLRGVWLTLHQDYIQTVLEWGWLGAGLWSVIFFGGMGVGLRNWWRQRETWTPRQRMLLPLLVLALGSVALHATLDFPLQIASLQFYAMVYLGICWGSGSWSIPGRHRGTGRKQRFTRRSGGADVPPFPEHAAKAVGGSGLAAESCRT